MSSYVTKTNLKNATGVHSSKLELKSTLASFFFFLIINLDIDKLKRFPIYLNNLSNVVKNDVFKRNVYDKLAPKVYNNFDTSGFI